MARQIKTSFLYKLYLNVVSSIAFFPTLISLSLFFVSLLTLYIDQGSPDDVVGYKMSIKNVINPDSARSLLTAIGGGIISLIVFSFSMVMVILNQTASNYSPRVLPTLIGRRSHQIIMGFYLGTVVYTFVILSSIKSAIYAFQVPSLSIIINGLLCLLCLALFVAFIQSISQNIQIGNIIINIYQDTHKSLNREMSEKQYIPAHQLPAATHWYEVRTPLSGYFNGINQDTLVKRAEKMDITIRMLMPLGKFVNQQDVFFLSDRSLNNKEQAALFQTFVFHHQEIVIQNYVFGFKQLTEIALKALSPGINDPGTAIQAIDRLTDLFVERLRLQGFPVVKDKQEKLRIIYQPVLLEDIFYFSFSTIRNCAGNDLSIMYKLLLMIRTLRQNDKEGRITALLLSSIQDAMEQFIPALQSSGDKQRLLQHFRELLSAFQEHRSSREVLQHLEKLAADR